MSIRKDKKNQTISDFQSITSDESFSRFNNKNKHQAVEPIYTPEFIQKCVDYNNSILEKKFGVYPDIKFLPDSVLVKFFLRVAKPDKDGFFTPITIPLYKPTANGVTRHSIVENPIPMSSLGVVVKSESDLYEEGDFVLLRPDTLIMYEGGPNISSLFTLNSNLSYKDFLNEDYGYLLLQAFDINAVLPKTPQIYEKFI
jgi:hypothetical protein